MSCGMIGAELPVRKMHLTVWEWVEVRMQGSVTRLNLESRLVLFGRWYKTAPVISKYVSPPSRAYLCNVVQGTGAIFCWVLKRQVES